MVTTVSLLYKLARPLLFALDAERAHAVGMRTLAAIDGTPLAAAVARALAVDDPILHTQLCGMQLRSPVGLAAGFDKDARAPAVFGALGFGFVEVGDRKSTRLNSSHITRSRMPSSA